MRSSLLACLAGTLALTALALPASAQQRLIDGPTVQTTAVAADAVQDLGAFPGTLTRASSSSQTISEPEDSAAQRLADCTDGQALEQLAATNFTGVVSGAQEIGQSFTAPCSGRLEAVVPVINRTNNAAVVWGATMRVYAGAGTAGTLLSATTFTFDNATGPAAAFFLTVTLNNPVDIVEGQVYTWFLDLTSNATGMQFSSANPYAGGMLYVTGNGNPASAGASAANDVQFALDFLAPQVRVETAINRNGVHYLAPPIGGVPVDALAGINLVRGITGYAAGPPNLFTDYDGTQWIAPADGTVELELGRAFRWTLRSGSVDYGSGSVLRPLPTTIFVDQTVANTAAVTLDLETDGDRFNYFGNPFGVPLDVSGIAGWDGGTLVGDAFEWDDDAGVFVDSDGTVDPWQAFFVKTRPGRTGTLTIPASAAVGSVAWEAAQSAEALLASEQGTAKTGTAGTALATPAPNPMRGSARVPFSLAEAGDVRLTVTDALGRRVAVLADGEFGEGAHTATFDTRDLAAGVYVLRLETGGEVLTQRATVVR